MKQAAEKIQRVNGGNKLAICRANREESTNASCCDEATGLETEYPVDDVTGSKVAGCLIEVMILRLEVTQTETGESHLLNVF